MAKRKTIDVKFLLKQHRNATNASLVNPNLTLEQGKAVRIELNHFLEGVLFAVNDYRGFQYINDYTVDDTARHYYGEI